ncbi:titin-like [Salvia divinorum]|uniref:Titin-like n=1 Tax=Salvia divinorum TaxID=28513 RepID=A0ABD1G947_SALDI
MTGDCDVSMLCKFEEEDLSVLSDEKQTEACVWENDIDIDPQHEIQTLDEDGELNVEGDDNYALSTQNDLSEEESFEVNVEGDNNSAISTQNDIDWNDQYPPLVSRAEISKFSMWWKIEALQVGWMHSKNHVFLNFLDRRNHVVPKCLDISTKVNGEKYCDSQVRVFFSINIPKFHDKVFKEQISLAELRIEDNGRELLKLKYEEMDSHLSMIVDRQTPNKTLKAESVAAVTPKQSNGDLKEDVSIEKVEEMERKEQKVEDVEELKEEKREKKRLRLRERKRAARDGFSLNTANQEVNKEASSSLDEMKKTKTAENQSEPSSFSMQKQIAMLKLVEDQDEIETHEYRREPSSSSSSSLNIQQQIAMLKFAELKEASKREKRRNKKKEKKKARQRQRQMQHLLETRR